MNGKANCGQTYYIAPSAISGVTNYRWALEDGPSNNYYLQGSNSPSYGLNANATFSDNGYWTVVAYAITQYGESPYPTHRYIFYVAGCRGGSSGVSFAYPNPVDDILTVDIDAFAAANPPAQFSGSRPIYDVRLYDGLGNMLRQERAGGGIIQFDVSNLPDGLYYLHIYDGVSNAPDIQKIIVQH